MGWTKAKVTPFDRIGMDKKQRGCTVKKGSHRNSLPGWYLF